MYDTILMPVDGSDVSGHALDEGLRLASELGSKVILMYVVDMTIAAMPEAELGVSNTELMRKSFEEQGEKVVRSAGEAAAAKAVRFETVMTEGDVQNEIIAIAEEKKVSLIVIGTHGRRGLNRLLLGSVAESVAKHAHCPVLLIRPA